MPQHDSNMRGGKFMCKFMCRNGRKRFFDAATCAHVDFRRASGFLYSAISPCKNPSNLSWCFWIPVERNFAKQEPTSATNMHMDSSIAMSCSTRIQIQNDKLLGLLDSTNSLYRKTEIRRASAWIPAWRNFAPQASRNHM